jgi:hypothetical protein
MLTWVDFLPYLLIPVLLGLGFFLDPKAGR